MKKVNSIDELDKFQGSLDNYISFKQEQYEMMETGRPDKFVRILKLGNISGLMPDPNKLNPDSSLITRLLADGCTGLIEYKKVPSNDSRIEEYWGTPVRRKDRIE